MKDIDFDEIDRAVNSVSSDNPVTNDNIASTTTQPDTSEPSKPAIQTPPALAGRRSSGQFMDVVHPSSNMRRAPINMPDRPLNQNTTPDTPTSPSVSEPQPTETELPTPTVPNSGWAELKDENEDADIDKINDDIVNELDHKSDELPDTPFISGTKVEKRPLGAFSTESTAPEVEPESENPISDDKKDDSLPDELQDNLLSIESKESTPSPEIQKEEAEPIEKPEVVEKPEVTKKPEASIVESKPAVATSITQQYEEKPSTGDKDSGPIYDTNAYHKPLASPVKKKSSWKIIIWILGILIIGVGAGILVYYFVRPIL
ncbi:MAG: hypothetical protein NTV39_01410 [Candidatus Saccharibacteria bacterium]|nr:hypothetical protein [Candidatus Saccharibacteria bacterium]